MEHVAPLGDEWIYPLVTDQSISDLGSKGGKKEVCAGPVPHRSGSILKGCFHGRGAISKGRSAARDPCMVLVEDRRL